jgi:hypothetical protein
MGVFSVPPTLERMTLGQITHGTEDARYAAPSHVLRAVQATTRLAHSK